MRFGIFEFQPDTGELYRRGVQVHLQAQPAQVLSLLLRHRGHIVTRNQFKEAVWGSETFVDFDKGLNFCIAQVRAALCDSAEGPIYIKTVPKRGYQFIAPVTPSVEHPASIGEIATIPSSAVSRFKGLWLPGLAILIVLVLFGALIIFWGRHPRYAQHQEIAAMQATRVAVARFDNETGDAQFERLADALSDSVTAKLTVAGANRFSVIGNAAILRTPRSQRDLTAIGSTLNAGYVVLAQVRHDPSHFFVLAHLIHLPDQTHVAVAELTCAANDSLQDESELAQHIADKFSPLIITRSAAATLPHTSM